MYGLFRITDNNEVIIDKDALKLVPELASLTPSEIKYVCLVYDWFDSPLRRKPIQLRKTQAKNIVWKEKRIDPEGLDHVKNGIEGYKSLVYNPTRETADVIRQRIHILNRQLLDEKLDPGAAQKIVNNIDFFTQRLEKLDREIKADDINFREIKGKLKLSFVEIWQRRMQDYSKANPKEL